MSIPLHSLVEFFDATLEPTAFADYCPNGLQVQGRDQVARLATGVTANQALIEAAIAWGADALLVHHGYFWRGEAPQIVGMKRRRLGALLGADMSLLAYHLPLDAHSRFGNNARFGELIGIDLQHQRALFPAQTDGVGSIADLQDSILVDELVQRIGALTQREPLHIRGGEDQVQRISWCTGAAQGYIEAAVAAGAQVYISGEASEQTVHVAREQGLHFIAAGHHATERYGVQALGEYAAQQLSLEHRFIDIDNPV